MAKDSDILSEAKERFDRCQRWESNARSHWKADYRFGHGDSTNLFQWANDTVDARTTAGKPTFTVNRVKNYCMQIVNDARQNKAQIEVRPVGNGASFEAAQIYEGVVRHIEYISNASQAYDHGCYDQVFGGIGWWRVVTDYANDASFDQEIFIRRVPNTLSVYMDPHIQEFDGSDAEFGFVFNDHDKDQFKKDHPRYDLADLPFDMETHDDHWVREDRIRVAEYFRKVYDADTIYYLPDGTVVRASQMPKSVVERAEGMAVRQRDVQVPRIEWYLIAGHRIVERNVWPGKYIPLVRVVGTETTIDGELDRMGHVRYLIDPQRSYNYYTSAGIEFVATQTKSPWIADVQSIQGVEEYWRDSNVKNFAVLPYNGKGDDGQPIEAPKRADPPVYAAAFLDGMKVAASEMELTSGQPPAVLGEQSNERSGKAVLERQRAASNTTYHFVDHLSSAIRFTGKILIDLIPKIYDTQRIIKILAQDGTLKTVQVDPNAPQPHAPLQALDAESFDPQQVSAIFNPTIGDYDVVADTGPQYATRRSEFVNAMMDILAQNESLTPLVGDLVFRNLDFPGAELIADRMRRNLAATNPAAVGNGDPQVQMLQKQLAQQHLVMTQMAQELQQAKLKSESVSYQKEIDMYKAISDRMKTMGAIDPEAIRPVIREEVSQLIGFPVNQAIAAHAHEDIVMEESADELQQAIKARQQAQQQQQAPQQPQPNPQGTP